MRLQISIEAENLKNVAGLFKGKSDPYAVISYFQTGEEIGRTETIDDNLNPKWTKIHYITDFDNGDMEESDDNNDNDTTLLEVSIYDDLFGKGDDKLMCEPIVVSLKDVYTSCSSGILYTQPIESNEDGILKIWVEESNESSEEINIQFRALDVRNIEKGITGLGKTDPFFEVYKKRSISRENGDGDDEQWQIVYRSEHIDENLNPLWEPFQLSLEDLCNDNYDRELKIDLFDWQPKGKHRIVGRIVHGIVGGDNGGESSDEENSSLNLGVILNKLTRSGNGDKSKAFRFKKVSRSNGEMTNRTVGYLIVSQAQLSES